MISLRTSVVPAPISSSLMARYRRLISDLPDVAGAAVDLHGLVEHAVHRARPQYITDAAEMLVDLAAPAFAVLADRSAAAAQW